VAFLCVAFQATGAAALGFSCITGTNAANCATGEAQLSVDVVGLGTSYVLFTFANSGPARSSITSVYFQDGTLLGIAGLIDKDDDPFGLPANPGVDFSPGASPPNLPGGNLVDFATTAGFLADADPPVQPNGVNPSETLGVIFLLGGGGSLATVMSELTTGQLRIGIHVQGFADGGSESFVNLAPPAPTPEPGTALLLGLGLSALALRRPRPQQ
jgi:hypothetical protein